MATSLGVGMMKEAVKRATGFSEQQGSLSMNPENANRIVKRLSRMRGAALKLGQMLSIQGSSLLDLY